MFHGIGNTEYYKAENLDIFGADVERILSEAKAMIIDSMGRE